MIMIGSKEGLEEDDDMIEEETLIEDKEMEACLNSNLVVGFSSPKTMKLLGQLNGKEVVVLIDSGATHNFISEELVKTLGIPVSLT